jgi:hypothetical protein
MGARCTCSSASVASKPGPRLRFKARLSQLAAIFISGSGNHGHQHPRVEPRVRAANPSPREYDPAREPSSRVHAGGIPVKLNDRRHRFNGFGLGIEHPAISVTRPNTMRRFSRHAAILRPSAEFRAELSQFRPWNMVRLSVRVVFIDSKIASR